MMWPSQHCLAIECETAKRCRMHVRKTHPHDVLFMSAVSGKDCPYFEPIYDEDDHDHND